MSTEAAKQRRWTKGARAAHREGKTKAAVFSVLLLFGEVGSALACSCGPLQSTGEAYRASTAVFLAKVIDSKRSPFRAPHGELAKGFFTEIAIMKVENAWKGVTVGQTVRFRSTIGPGPCGISCREAPFKILDSDTKRAFVPRVSEWLVFVTGNEPYELSMCSRSWPADDLASAHAVHELNVITGRLARHRKN